MKKLLIAGALLLSTIGFIPESNAYVVCNAYGCHRVGHYGYGYGYGYRPYYHRWGYRYGYRGYGYRGYGWRGYRRW